MDLEILETTGQVIDALGGNVPVADITSRTPPAVSNWRKLQTFPANTYFAITGALQSKGKTAPVSLWRMRGT